MYKAHSVFKLPNDENIKVWRYIDITKFIDLLETGLMYFNRADKFPDSLEGSYTEDHITVEQTMSKGLFSRTSSTHCWSANDLSKISLPAMRPSSDIRKKIRELVYVNCWHINSCESEAMWGLYGNNKEGLAIQTTFAKLRDSFNSETFHEHYIGEVQYGSLVYDNGFNLLSAFLQKRRSFAHENELRILTPYINSEINLSEALYSNREKTIANPSGLKSKVDLSLLIENIFIHPRASSLYSSAVRYIASKYKLSNNLIKQSSLSNNEALY